MLKFNKIHLDYMRTFVPFYDTYVLIEAKEKKPDHAYDCVVDTRYTKLQYMVFAMLLKDSTVDTFETNLRQPGKWIGEALKAQAARKVEQASAEKVKEILSSSRGEQSGTSRLARDIFQNQDNIHNLLGSNLLKENLTHEAVEDFRSQIALQNQTTEEIEAALKEATEIIFEAEVEDLPMYSSSNWQFLVDLRYRFTKLKNIEKSVKRSITIAKNKEEK
jgi:hypothetical protein